ncbi:Na/Pi cotransporter family protein [Pseudohongiella sp.]|uniref:PhoU domain-containing protein n=1 Tax=marine sediment metagenome TaxID=412755 RepID=A0A0F9W2K4_9ZZZZ|nr:Na/Pi symporter [Pseudohongiella sp.]HDZ09258.1 Na/Pi cotransporter family protein [Pseudohongiella sp.]HEA62122.1 Na/Pi cotransporter family protein [Pseudohongiella sp.]
MLIALGTLAGGLGLFLLSVSMITDGLKLAAGGSLRDILGRSTATVWRGIVSGAFLTSLVQSSSAVTVATIGFVNAGLLGIHQALGVVLGATIGTTMTGWLVAIVGFNFSITAFALPMVGAGMTMRLVGPSRRLGALGEAIAGFGLFFIGIDFLRGAFEGFAQNMDLASLAPEGFAGAIIFVGVGFVMTLLTQSSSAAIAITLTALTGGVISFPAAAAAAIGATVGTTSTSALAVIGATSNARRVAAGHVIINGFNAVLGIALLPGVIWLASINADMQQYPALSLALFHTSFNVLGVLLLIPFMKRVSAWLERRFVGLSEKLGRPQYLDSNVMVSPALAMDAFFLELKRMAELARDHAVAALNNEGSPDARLKAEHDGLRQLVRYVEKSVTDLEKDRLGSDVAQQLPMILRIANYIDEAVAHAQACAETDSDVEYLLQTDESERILLYRAAVLKHLAFCNPDRHDFSADEVNQAYQALRVTWRDLKTDLLDASVGGRIPVQRLNPAIDSLRMMLRVAERATRIAIRLAELGRGVPLAGKSVPDRPAGSSDQGAETAIGSD